MWLDPARVKGCLSRVYVVYEAAFLLFMPCILKNGAEGSVFFVISKNCDSLLANG